jgi:Spy/CpxP family protein refolding chaperone
LGKRLLQFYELPEPERSRAFDAWLNSAGTPKRNAERKKRVREFFGLMEAIAKKLTPRQRAPLRKLGKAILSKA